MNEACYTESSFVSEMIVKEFLEERLGILPTSQNVRRFIAHIEQFEQEVYSEVSQ